MIDIGFSNLALLLEGDEVPKLNLHVKSVL